MNLHSFNNVAGFSIFIRCIHFEWTHIGNVLLKNQLQQVGNKYSHTTVCADYKCLEYHEFFNDEFPNRVEPDDARSGSTLVRKYTSACFRRAQFGWSPGLFALSRYSNTVYIQWSHTSSILVLTLMFVYITCHGDALKKIPVIKQHSFDFECDFEFLLLITLRMI